MLISDLAALCTGVSEATTDADSMEGAAASLARYLRNSFGEVAGGPEIVMARVFQTVRFDSLGHELREYAAARARAPLSPDQRCLVLMGTDGDLPQWRDRRRSVDHQAIPLANQDGVRSMPMVAALVDHFGLSMDDFLGDAEGPFASSGKQDSLEVFYVPDASGSPDVPAQDFVREHGVRSVLGFGGVLPGGDVFAIILFTRVRIPEHVAELFQTVAVAAKLALLPSLAKPLLRGEADRFADEHAVARSRIQALEQMLQVQRETVLTQAFRLEEALRDAVEARRLAERESRANEALREVTTVLSAELDPDRLVQTATDAATRVTGARYGAFFYNVVDSDGEQYTLYTLSGAPRSAFEKFPNPRNTALFGPTFRGEGVIRSDDITADPRFGQNAPYDGLPPDHLPVRSYLAVPVKTAAGEVTGCFFFGHPEVGVFDGIAEKVATGIAVHAAVALDNARLYRAERETALALQRSLLPRNLPSPQGVDLAYEYSPGSGGRDVGGDWFDVIPLSGGRTAFVIGDVMGRGVQAAAIMGQLRTAIRAYAVSGLLPEQVIGRLNQLLMDMGDDLIATCTYAVLDQSETTLTLSSAGHLPPALVDPDGGVSYTAADLGPPLGVPGAVHHAATIDFPTGSTILWFTDGLVEHRTRPLHEGLDQLLAVLGEIGPRDPHTVCPEVIARLVDEQTQDDDMTVLVVANRGLRRRDVVEREFPTEARSAEQARRWVERVLTDWGDHQHAEVVVPVVHELVVNALLHAESPITVQLRRLPDLVVAEVGDHDGRLPRRTHAGPADEQFRGLQIVESISSRWGSRLTEHGKVVWAEFAIED
jgi:serine phosphatase RsbU (regulator of sigma subunit)